jgi:hypothetical protein
MADRKLYDEIESSLMAAHEKGIDWSTIDIDREASVVAAEAVMAFMVPALAAIEKSILRLARELDDLRNA